MEKDYICTRKIRRTRKAPEFCYYFIFDIAEKEDQAYIIYYGPN